MPHVFEHAASGRAKCRGCARPIERGVLRFGERVPNPYGEGEATFWYHPLCAAFKRPEALLEALPAAPQELDAGALESAARATAAHPRLPRIAGAERSPTGQAKCRHCHEPIDKGSWRIRLTSYEDGRFAPSGFLHFDCRREYFEGADIAPAVLHLSPDLSDADREALIRELP